MNTSLRGEEIHSLDGNELEDANSAATGLSVPITSEEVALQIGATTNPSTKQLEMLGELMGELHRDAAKREKGTSAPAQGPSGKRGSRSDMVEGSPQTRRCDLLTEPMNPTMRQPDNKIVKRQKLKRQR